jgi:hypothetical protein
MSSPRLWHSRVIASTSAQQTGHQATNVPPLYTISRLSVSIVILVVFTTTYAPIRTALLQRLRFAASCANQARKVFNARLNISQGVSRGFFCNKYKGLRQRRGAIAEQLQGR